jgi:hypothetical protein
VVTLRISLGPETDDRGQVWRNLVAAPVIIAITSRHSASGWHFPN